jgi:hypothetical protein
MLVRLQLPLSELRRLLSSSSGPLPTKLRQSYYALLRHAYLSSASIGREASVLTALVTSSHPPQRNRSYAIPSHSSSICSQANALKPLCDIIGSLLDELLSGSATFGGGEVARDLVPTLTLYLRHLVPAEDLAKRFEALADALSVLPDTMLQPPKAEQQLSPAELVHELQHALHARGFGASASFAAANVTQNDAGREVSAPVFAVTADEKHPQEFVDDFMDDYYVKEQGGVELGELVSLFHAGLQKALRKANTLATKQRVSVSEVLSRKLDVLTRELPGVANTNAIMRYLLNVVPKQGTHNLDDDGEQIFNTELAVHMLGVLSQILEETTSRVDAAAGPATLRSMLLADASTQQKPDASKEAMQTLLNTLGASTLVLRFASCANNDLARAGLRLGRAMLSGGNRAVQRSLLKLLMDTQGSEGNHAPADGSKGSFFSSMKARIHMGTKEIKERKAYLAQREERRAQLAEITAGLSPRAREMMKEDIEREVRPQHFCVQLVCRAVARTSARALASTERTAKCTL